MRLEINPFSQHDTFSTFQAFLTDKLKLSGLGKQHPLEGKRPLRHNSTA